MKKKSTEEFKHEVFLKFPNLTVLGEYQGCKLPIIVRDFCGHTRSIIPQKLLGKGQKSTCKICVGISTRKDPSQFNTEFNNKFPDLELLDVYTNSTTSLRVKCFNGHTWNITPNGLLTKGIGSKCPECTIRVPYNKKTHEQFVNEVSTLNLGIKILDQYIDSNTPIRFECINGHTFSIAPNILINRGIGCKQCTLDETAISYINKLNDKFPLLQVRGAYKGTRELIRIECMKGHTWSTLAGNLLYYGCGSNCEICNPSYSKGEEDLIKFIQSIYSGWIELHDRTILKPLELDIVLPDLGIAFEYNGMYWHSDKFKDKNYHNNKTKEVCSFGYQLIHINEDEWLNRQDIVKSRIRNLIKGSDKIYARKCTVREISFPKNFLIENHLQGAGVPSSTNLGLYLNEELVAVMTFSTPKFSKEYTFELVRFCSLLDITVVGGASKLLSYFLSNYKGSIVSYSDRRWSTGRLYQQLGFTYSHTSSPNYMYHKGYESLSRYQCQKHLLKDRFPITYKDCLSESEIMLLEGYSRVYDCGNDVWILA